MYHQHYKAPDGSECIRVEPGDPWTVIKGDGTSKAHKLANQQNKFWRPWHKESIARHDDVHDDEDDTFSRRIKKP